MASPDAPLARLQSATPMPTSTQRDRRSASRAKTGAPIMYTTMKAVPSRPISASSGLKPRRCWNQLTTVTSALPSAVAPWPMPLAPKKLFLIGPTTAAST